MTEEEKMEHLNNELSKLHEFLKQIEGTGRSYDSSVRLTRYEFEWIMKKLNEVNV